MRADVQLWDTFTPALVSAFAESRSNLRKRSWHIVLTKATNDCMKYWVAEALKHIPMAEAHTIKSWLVAPARKSKPPKFSRMSRAPKMNTKAAVKRAVQRRDMEDSRAMAIVVAVLVHNRRGAIPDETLKVIYRHGVKAYKKARKGGKSSTLNAGAHEGLLRVAQALIGARLRSRGYLKGGMREARRIFRVSAADDGPTKFHTPPGAARAAEIAQSMPYAWAEDFAKGILTVAPNAFANSERAAVEYLKRLMLENLRDQAARNGLAVT